MIRGAEVGAPPEGLVDPGRGDVLLRWARASVRAALGGPRAAPPRAAWGQELAATFVTWRWADTGDLQGCIGSLEPRRALLDDVAHHAVAAALEDPRTQPLVHEAQLDELDLEISELGRLSPIELAGGSEAEAALALRPGLDGVVLAWHGRRATLLPAVWESLPEPMQFLRALQQKAGMPRGGWDETVRLFRYGVTKHRGPAPVRRAS